MPVEKLQLDRMYPIVANDAIEYARSVILYVGLGGDLRVLTANGDDVTFTNIPAGYFLPVHVKKVFSTGTTAGQFLATDFDGDVLDYFSTLPSWVTGKYSLAFDAEGAEELGDYEAGTLYFRDAAFGRVPATFSRTTTATRVNEQGLIETVAANVPRIDYTDGSAKLLLEPSRTNLLTYSEDFSNAAWLKDRLNTTGTPPWVNQEIAPDGTLTAEKIIQQSGQINAGYLQQSKSVSAGEVTFSVFAKKGTRHWIVLRTTITGSNLASWFNTDTGTIGSVESGLTAKIEEYPNGWYRCSITCTAVGGGSFQFYNTDKNGVLSVADDGGYQYIWGAQVEEGSYPTSYIPTAGSTVTRNVDSIVNFTISSYFNTNEGSVYWKYNENPLQLAVGANVNAFAIMEQIGTKYFRHRGSIAGEIFQAGGFATTISLIANNLSYAIKWDGSNFTAFSESALVGATSQTADFNPIKLGLLGNLTPETTTSYEHILFFPAPLTNTELQQLTS